MISPDFKTNSYTKVDCGEAQPFRPACLIYSCKSQTSCPKNNPPYTQLSQILYHTISQHISSLRSTGGGSAVDPCCKQAQTRLVIPSGHLRGEGCGSLRKRRFASALHCTVFQCICLFCWLLKNVSWPLCPIPGGVISPALFSQW